MTVNEYRKIKESARPGRSRNKYNAQKTGSHASKKEHRRAVQLKIMEKAGLISNLREQVRYELIPAQHGTCGNDLNGKEVRVLIERACSYVADFVYTDCQTGKTVVEDTKGVRTKEYIIKRKLMLFRHGIQIREV